MCSVIRSANLSFHQRHHRNTRLKAGQSERELRKNQQCNPDHAERTSVTLKQVLTPARQHLWMTEDS